MSDTEIEPRKAKAKSPGARSGHHWMMIACCIPMLVLAVVLVATGVAGPGFIVVALGCTAMMAMMLGAMDHGDSHPNHPR